MLARWMTERSASSGQCLLLATRRSLRCVRALGPRMLTGPLVTFWNRTGLVLHSSIPQVTGQALERPITAQGPDFTRNRMMFCKLG